MRRKHITSCDVDQALLPTAILRSCAQTESYLLRSGGDLTVARERLPPRGPGRMVRGRRAPATAGRGDPRALCGRCGPRLCSGGRRASSSCSAVEAAGELRAYTSSGENPPRLLSAAAIASSLYGTS